MSRRMRDKIHPNNLIGTDGHRKNVEDKVKGSRYGCLLYTSDAADE